MRAIIVDDEPLLRFHLDKMLAECWPELDIVDKAGDGPSALTAVEQLGADIVFLDIRMPGMTGIEVAQKLNQLEQPPHIVFTTAFDEYAVQAFEQQAIDYLLKPLDEQRLLQTCQRIQQRQASPQTKPDYDLQALVTALDDKPQYLQWIKASKGESLELVAIDSVLAFVAEDKYTTVRSQQGDYVIRTPLKELLGQIQPGHFWQIHRSTLVKVNSIKRVNKNMLGKLTVELVDGSQYPVSRSANHLFKAM
ncbi:MULTISPECIES: LytR/AlgR family response regulator transcription factor [unclassified Agarivorans]|uniref:LytR/AlgR family response regulator transcription factor n=1 Tax=unclassified Agarivorans TaxID=2636026 RepID=UPI0026E3CAA0|nr:MULTISPECIES: LytTR family DNA-binding domain-containing protein [unclassified Agarivorans]MDO6687958.1 LytTR family DNA-binding domain-containing protein [Agarivorans sp. 3_MG-2023]MDO6717580.1 LytTR family DNA-binding domain-containing protein [Agarivorans sp. 2_MG-2023]